MQLILDHLDVFGSCDGSDAGVKVMKVEHVCQVMRQAIEETCTNLAGAGAGAGAMSSWSGHDTVSSSHMPRFCIAGENWQYWQGEESGGWVGLWNVTCVCCEDTGWQGYWKKPRRPVVVGFFSRVVSSRTARRPPSKIKREADYNSWKEMRGVVIGFG